MSVLTFITISTALLVLGTISLGVYFNYHGCDEKQVKMKKFLKINLSTFIPMLAAALIVMAPVVVAAATGGEPGGVSDAG